MIFFKIVTIGDGYQIDSKKLNSYIPQFTFATSIFPDIPTTHPNYQAIQYVQEQGIVQGYEDPSDSSGQAALYKPDNPINRAEFTKILIGASVHTSTVTGNNCFPDVQDQWFAPFVCTAKAHNIVAGNPDGTFLPAANINTAEAAKIIVHTFHLPVPPGLPSDPWYTSYITALTAANALPQTAAKPDHILTRAEMAEMMYRIAQ